MRKKKPSLFGAPLRKSQRDWGGTGGSRLPLIGTRNGTKEKRRYSGPRPLRHAGGASAARCSTTSSAFGAGVRSLTGRGSVSAHASGGGKPNANGDDETPWLWAAGASLANALAPTCVQPGPKSKRQNKNLSGATPLQEDEAYSKPANATSPRTQITLINSFVESQLNTKRLVPVASRRGRREKETAKRKPRVMRGSASAANAELLRNTKWKPAAPMYETRWRGGKLEQRPRQVVIGGSGGEEASEDVERDEEELDSVSPLRDQVLPLRDQTSGLRESALSLESSSMPSSRPSSRGSASSARSEGSAMSEWSTAGARVVSNGDTALSGDYTRAASIASQRAKEARRAAEAAAAEAETLVAAAMARTSEEPHSLIVAVGGIVLCDPNAGGGWDDDDRSSVGSGRTNGSRLVALRMAATATSANLFREEEEEEALY